MKWCELGWRVGFFVVLVATVELPSPARAGDRSVHQVIERALEGCGRIYQRWFGPYWTLTEDGCVSKPLRDSMSDSLGRCTPLEVQAAFADAVVAQGASGWGHALKSWYVSPSTQVGTYDRLAFLRPAYSLTVEGFAAIGGGYNDRYVLDVQIQPNSARGGSLARVSLEVRIHRELDDVNRENAKAYYQGSMREAQQAFLNALFGDVAERAKTACH